MNSEENHYSLKCGVSSFLATYIAGILHPLDLLKTRFQSHDGKASRQNLVPKYEGVYKGLKQIHKAQGIKGLYKGFYISLLSQALTTSFFFLLYQARKKRYQERGYQTMNAVSNASIEASFVATLLTQPIWVIKTRMLLNIQPNVGQFENAIGKAREIYHQNGIKGFSKGIQLSLLLSFSGMLQMYVYEGSKLIYDQLKIPQTKMAEKNFICGSISKLVSVLITYPITTIRTRIQQNQFIAQNSTEKYRGLRDITLKLLCDEGYKGFYKGLVPNMMRGIFQRGIYFYFYQTFKCFLISPEEYTH